MKNSNFFLLAITAATVVSCGTHPSSYTINGTGFRYNVERK